MTYSLTDEAAVDLRNYDGSEYVDSYIGLSLTYDTTIFSPLSAGRRLWLGGGATAS